MKKKIRQQMVISGVGGQGVLFITRLIAEAAIDKGLPVLTSETHGMAQRGGTVVSHIKTGDFTSPLIRPRMADGLLALKAEIPDAHLLFLGPDSWAAVNSDTEKDYGKLAAFFNKDCDRLAIEIGSVRSTNLVLLGFALAATTKEDYVRQPMFCSIEDIRNVLFKRFSGNKKILDGAVRAIEAGYDSRRSSQ